VSTPFFNFLAALPKSPAQSGKKACLKDRHRGVKKFLKLFPPVRLRTDPAAREKAL
jgi:hypothetical protein